MKPRYKKHRPAQQQDKQTEVPFFAPAAHAPVVQRAANGTPAAAFVPPGPGSPLPATVQQFFAPRMGLDLSGVQVHTGDKAAASAQSLGAKAYTYGGHIVFNNGQYNPEARDGQRLLAHELTHVAQQQSGRSTGIQREPLGGDDNEKGAALMTSYQNSIEIDSFELGKPGLTPDHQARLADYKKQISGLLMRYPDSFLTLWGHTDAVDSEAKNEALGLARAEAVKAELTSGESALPEAMISTRTMGEREPVVKSASREPKNRRVQLMFSARRFLSTPKLDWTPQPPPKFDYKLPEQGTLYPPYRDPGPDYTRKIPDLKIKRKTPIEAILEDDPILKKLPPDWREKVIDAAKDGDESLVEKALDFLPVEGSAKEGIKAAVKAAIQSAKGRKWEPPPEPLYPMPPSGAPPYVPAPGEQLYKLPPIKFDENDIIKWFKRKF